MAAIIPITLAPSSLFDISLEDGDFLMRVNWMTRSATWVIDLEKEGEVLINGLRLVLGTDLVGQFDFGIGIWTMLDLANNGDDATRSSLGTDIVLYYIPESERDQLDG